MRFAQGADALQIAHCRWLGPSDLFGVEVKRSHSALQQISCVRASLANGAQFRGGHPHVSGHALDIPLIATSEIRSRATLDPSATPVEQGSKRGLALSSLGWRKHLILLLATKGEELEVWRCQSSATRMSRVDLGQSPPRSAIAF